LKLVVGFSISSEKGMKSNILLSILIVFLSLNGVSQIPELQLSYEKDVITFAELEDEFKNTDDQESRYEYMLRLARLAYKIGETKQATEYFLQIPDLDILSLSDLKTLACALQMNGSKALADEIYSLYTSQLSPEYLKSYQNLYAQVESHRVYDHQESIEALAGGSMNLNIGNNSNFHLVKEGKSYTTAISCDGRISQTNSLNLPNENMGLGSFTYIPNDNSYIFSLKGDNGTYGLYHAFWSIKKQKWKKVKRIQTFAESANNAFPVFADGSVYFCSDDESGYGGYDLYKSSYSKGKLSSIQNLGETINTEFNEINPSYQNFELYFSSNGYPGLGGYDIYRVDEETRELNHLAYPQNTDQNDWKSFKLNSNNFLALRDLSYKTSLLFFEESATAVIPAISINISGQLLDNEGERIANTPIYFSRKNASSGTYARTQGDGSYALNLSESGSFIVEAKISGFEDYREEITLGDSIAELEYIIRMVRKKDVASNDLPKPVPEIPIPRSNDNNPKKITPKNDVVSQDDSIAFDDMTPVIPRPHPVPTPKPADAVYQQTNEYLAIIGATTSLDGAKKFQRQWSSKFSDEVLIYFFPKKNLYRIGLNVGQNKTDALAKYYQHKKVFANAWLLAP